MDVLNGRDSRFVNTAGKKVGYAAMFAAGSIVGAGTGFAGILTAVVGVAASQWAFVATAIMGCVCIPAAAVAVCGARELKLLKQFERYKTFLGSKPVSDISDMAYGAAVSERQALSDVRRMLKKGWFRQGRLTHDSRSLVLTDAAWQDYLVLRDRTEQRLRGEEERRRIDALAQGTAAKPPLPPAVQKLRDSCRGYISRLSAVSSGIRDAEMRGKTERIYLLADRIVQRLEAFPECAEKLSKFESYYLPTALKLAGVFYRMEEEKVSGAHIHATREEIGAALSSLESAFSKLFDNLYEDTAWELSADVAVLNAVLAREGLAGNDFPDT